MSVQNALRFIAAVREDAALRQRIAQLGVLATLDDFVIIGAERGCEFNGGEMQQAYRFDWSMRRARYSPSGAPGPEK